MATTLTVQTVTRSGISITALAVAADATGNNWATNGYELLYLNNASVGAITLTLTSSNTLFGETVTARTVTLNASTVYIVGPFEPAIYRDGNGRMNVTYSGVTSLTVVPFKW